MATCKDCEFGGSCVMLHKSDSQVCNIFTHKKDYVEVVRCKDCKKISPSVTAVKNAVWCREFRAYMPIDGFCSYGERKERE